MKAFFEIVVEGTIYCIVMIAIIILMSTDYDKRIKKLNKEKQQLQIRNQLIEQENTILRQKLKQQNNASFQILVATIEQIEVLKDSNQKLTKEVAQMLEERKKFDSNNQMMYFGNKKINK